METPMRIALLFVGLGVGGISAEITEDEKSRSPIFVPTTAREPRPVTRLPERTPVSRQLAALIRREATAAPPAATDGRNQEPAEPGSETLQLEKMTVKGKRIPEPPRRETAVEKFTRTGYLWEFSSTKRLMIGPRGDKVGVMFSFDW